MHNEKEPGGVAGVIPLIAALQPNKPKKVNLL